MFYNLMTNYGISAKKCMLILEATGQRFFDIDYTLYAFIDG